MVSEKVIEQIKTVRDTELTNMMDVRRVQKQICKFHYEWQINIVVRNQPKKGN